MTLFQLCWGRTREYTVAVRRRLTEMRGDKRMGAGQRQKESANQLAAFATRNLGLSFFLSPKEKCSEFSPQHPAATNHDARAPLAPPPFRISMGLARVCRVLRPEVPVVAM